MKKIYAWDMSALPVAAEEGDIFIERSTCVTYTYIGGEWRQNGTLPPVEDTMSGTSKNPVQNKTIKAYVDTNSASTADVLAVIAPAYDATSTYALGAYCIYDKKLYKCTTAIETAEAWTAAHWTQTTVMAEVSAE